jgi:signal transduction histidine kinase
MPTERVLVVDDDPAILQLCQRILKADGYAVTTVKRGEEALSKLESETFDLLLTDIRLPGLDGLEVTTRLRERGLELVVITMTGYSNMEMAIQALRLGVDEFVIKPFTPDTLRVHVTRALDKAKLRRENMRLRTLVPLLRSAQVLAAARSRQEIYQELFSSLAVQLQVCNAVVLGLDNEAETLALSAGQGPLELALRNVKIPVAQLPQRESFFAHEVQYWNQIEEPRLPCGDCGEWFASVALKTRARDWGLLVVESPQLSASNAECLHLIAAQTATALENVDLVAQVSEAYVNLSKLDHMKSEFINVAGHELRTPLAAILGYAKLLHDRTQGEAKSFADVILVNGERLQRIVDDMLSLKYLQQGPMDLHLEELGVERVVAEVVEAYRSLADQKGQAIELDIATQVGRVTADRAMLDMMLGNILSNAIKFSPPNTHVRVVAEGDADAITFSVQDQGHGLSPEEAAQVFEPFYQASDSLTRSHDGIGLGLTLTREMVRAHGGKIWVESQANHGSAFYIVLPRRAQKAHVQ